MVLAHLVELLDRPNTRQMAEKALEEATIVHTLPVDDEEIPF